MNRRQPVSAVRQMRLFGSPEHGIMPNIMLNATGLAEEQELIQRGIEMLRALPNVTKVRRVPFGGRRRTTWEPDAVVEVVAQGRPATFALEAARALRAGGAWAARARVWEQATEVPVLLVTYYCPRTAAEELVRAGVNFVDLAGNAHLKTPRFWLYLHGRKPTPMLARAVRGEKGVLAGTAALRVIYALLARPGDEWRMRDLAAKAGVALGWTNAIVQALRAEGIVRQTKRRGQAVVLKRRPLFDRWATDYGAVLRPHLALGTYAPVDGIVDDVVARIPKGAPVEGKRLALGGTWGANAFTHFYRGPRLVIHAEPPQQRWLHPLRIIPDERGMVTLLAPVAPIMWADVTATEAGPVAPPLVLYADLLADPDPRARELAQQLAGMYPEILGGD